jgi:hypothetical protein
MKRTIVRLAIGACLLFSSAGAVFATGQPGASAGVQCTISSNALLTPGNSGSATNPAGTNGSPFNQAIAKEYAGNAGSPTTAIGTHASPNAVSQYDIACLQVSKQVP